MPRKFNIKLAPASKNRMSISVRNDKKTLGTKVKAIEKQLRKQKPESKAVTVQIVPTNPAVLPYTGYSATLTQIAQGDLVSNRQGDEVTINSISLKGNIVIGATGSDSSLQGQDQCVQFFMVEDTQVTPDQTTVNPADVWETAVSYNPQTLERSIDARGRYKILEKTPIMFLNRLIGSDQVVPLASPLTPTANPNFHLYHRFKGGFRVRYNGAGIADIQKRGIFFVAMSSYVTPNGHAPYLSQCNARLNFYDN